MRTTVYAVPAAGADGFDEAAVRASIEARVAAVAGYVPGYRCKSIAVDEQDTAWGRVPVVILHMRRQVREDYELRGQTLKAGDKLALFYCSGNFDEDVFEEPLKFDITRPATKSQAFGGGGPHFCLGNILAKQMMKHALREIYTRMPDLQVGTPDYLESSFMHGVKRLPATWTP